MSLYQFSCLSINGELIPMDTYRGKVLLIVNTASKCGFTPQYKGLECLYRKYRDAGLVVMGFPCDQFGHQEFDSEEEVEHFCVNNYNVSFPLFAKVRVKGTNADPLFQYLSNTARGCFGSKAIKWNFTKFLINRDATRIKRFATTTYPSHLSAPIEKLLHTAQ